MVQDAVENIFAVARFALAYPGAEQMELLKAWSSDVPESIEELRSLYMRLFEAALPHPAVPLLESHYVMNRPEGQVVLENKLFYRNFGLDPHSRAAPDSLLAQLEFLSWLEHCKQAGNPDAESIDRAGRDFLELHVRPWLPHAARLARSAEGRCYADLMEALADWLG